MNHRTIKVPSGIGDFLWLCQKLIHTGERFVIQMPAGRPQRLKPFVDLIYEIVADSYYVKGMNYETLRIDNIQLQKPYWREITEPEFALSCNDHVDSGKRLELFLPDLPTSFHGIPLHTEMYAQHVKDDFPGTRYIGIYGSSYNTSRNWGFWQEDKWSELISMVYKHNRNYTFVLIGADFDVDMNDGLSRHLAAMRIPFINTTGKHIAYVIELMKRLHYFFAFASGLPIISAMLNKPCAMFYPPHHIPLMNAWADPVMINEGSYKGVQYCEPEVIFNWCKENKWI